MIDYYHVDAKTVALASMRMTPYASSGNVPIPGYLTPPVTPTGCRYMDRQRSSRHECPDQRAIGEQRESGQHVDAVHAAGGFR